MRFFLYGLLAIVVILIMVLVSLLLFSLVSPQAVTAVALGSMVAIVFVTAGYLSFSFALKFKQKKFNKIVGISILGRLVLMTLSIVSILLFLNINKSAFLIGMFVSYFVSQIWEVISLNKILIREV